MSTSIGMCLLLFSWKDIRSLRHILVPTSPFEWARLYRKKMFSCLIVGILSVFSLKFLIIHEGGIGRTSYCLISTLTSGLIPGRVLTIWSRCLWWLSPIKTWLAPVSVFISRLIFTGHVGSMLHLYRTVDPFADGLLFRYFQLYPIYLLIIFIFWIKNKDTVSSLWKIILVDSQCLNLSSFKL